MCNPQNLPCRYSTSLVFQHLSISVDCSFKADVHSLLRQIAWVFSPLKSEEAIPQHTMYFIKCENMGSIYNKQILKIYYLIWVTTFRKSTFNRSLDNPKWAVIHKLLTRGVFTILRATDIVSRKLLISLVLTIATSRGCLYTRSSRLEFQYKFSTTEMSFTKTSGIGI